MRILCTGVAGFLASHLAERLLAMGHEVVGVDNLVGGEQSNVPTGVDFWEEDCCHREIMLELCQDVDIVFHAAASPHEGLSVFSPAIVVQNTLQSTISMASAACASGVRRFVFCSSMARYGTGEWTYRGVPYREDDEPNPIDPYGVAKLAAEDILTILTCEHDIELVIAVPHSIFGPNQRYYDPFRNVVSIFMNLMLQGRQPIIYGDGEQKRCFTYIDDAIDPLLKCGLQDGLDGEIINIGPDEEFVTINDLARRIAKVLQFDLHPTYMPDRPREVKLAYCSSDKARRLLGYKTTVSLDDGLAKMATWMRSVGPRKFEYSLPIEIPGSKRIPATWRDRIF